MITRDATCVLCLQPETAYKACLELSELALAHSVNARVVGHGMDMANLDDLDSHITRMLTSADQPVSMP
eukprot:565265-Pelagomonas_calceolata.AAC.4